MGVGWRGDLVQVEVKAGLGAAIDAFGAAHDAADVRQRLDRPLSRRHEPRRLARAQEGGELAPQLVALRQARAIVRLECEGQGDDAARVLFLLLVCEVGHALPHKVVAVVLDMLPCDARVFPTLVCCVGPKHKQ